MRIIYLTSGDVVATTSEKDLQGGSGSIGHGIMLDADGRTIGFDLFAEVEPGKWVIAGQLQPGMLGEERRRGTLVSGIMFQGEVRNYLNVRNIQDRLVASRMGLEAKEYKSGPAAFRAQEVGSSLDRLITQIKGLRAKLQWLQVQDEESCRAEKEALQARVKKAEKTVRMLQKEQAPPLPEDSGSLEWFDDLSGRHFLTTQSLEALIRSSLVADMVERQGPLLLDPERMRALRTLLLS